MDRRRVQRCPVSGEVPQRTGVGEMLFNELEHGEMDIMFLLKHRFLEFNPLLSPGGEKLAAVDELMALERRLFGVWLNRIKS